MNITWLGHSCFALEEDGYRLITDPYRGVPGYAPIRAAAHAVFCSHDHFDHNFRAGVALLTPRENPFAVREISSWHDDVHGAKRGPNTIRCFTAGGVTVCHLGDLGHLLSQEQVRQIGPVDVLMIPVGGVYTLGPGEARAVAEQLSPRCLVPMHYRHAPYGLEELGGAEAFLAQYAPSEVRRLDGNAFAVTPELAGVLVPSYRMP